MPSQFLSPETESRLAGDWVAVPYSSPTSAPRMVAEQVVATYSNGAVAVNVRVDATSYLMTHAEGEYVPPTASPIRGQWVAVRYRGQRNPSYYLGHRVLEAFENGSFAIDQDSPLDVSAKLVHAKDSVQLPRQSQGTVGKEIVFQASDEKHGSYRSKAKVLAELIDGSLVVDTAVGLSDSARLVISPSQVLSETQATSVPQNALVYTREHDRYHRQIVRREYRNGIVEIDNGAILNRDQYYQVQKLPEAGERVLSLRESTVYPVAALLEGDIVVTQDGRGLARAEYMIALRAFVGPTEIWYKDRVLALYRKATAVLAFADGSVWTSEGYRVRNYYLQSPGFIRGLFKPLFRRFDTVCSEALETR